MTAERVAIVAAVKSHLDGDPEPRPDELIECDQLRDSLNVQTFVLVIATSRDLDDWHAWAISKRDDGKIVYREAGLRIVGDEG